MLARYVPWEERVCEESQAYRELAGSWAGSRRGLCNEALVTDWRNIPHDRVRAAFSIAVSQDHGWRRDITGASELDLLKDLAEESSAFGFNLENEAVWGLTATAAEQLLPVAEAFVAARGAQRLWDDADPAEQRFVAWGDLPPLRGADLDAAVAASMQHLRIENAGLSRSEAGGRPGPGRYGSLWWSAPSFAEQSWSTNGPEGIWSMELLDSSDSYGPADPEEAITGGAGPALWRLKIDPRSRIFEVGCVSDWKSLVDQFPCEVSATHGDDWSRWTKAPGPWLLPDWENVRERYDGVHVSVGAYFSSSGIAVPVRGGYSMLAGWLPGATLWLMDTITESHREEQLSRP
jgi:hypothetical protein